MGSLGSLLIYAALASTVVAIVSGALGGLRNDARLARRAEQATYLNALFVSGAVLVLQLSLVTLDFSIAYVGEYTSNTLSIPYRIGSMWAGMGGSLLLWGWMVSLLAAALVAANRRRALGISSWAYAIAIAYAGLFVFMSGILNSPFAPAETAVTDGMGLNPLLQDPLQLIHPLFLYGGFVSFTLPFAVVVGQLLAGRLQGAEWISYARSWSLISWLSLTIGIMLGARWAYAELGWGGYWAWDPVENASLIPWFTATAVLHLGLAHRGAKDRLRMRSAIMLMVTFALCLFGTFLTRSGVIQSVHAFGISNLGPLLGTVILLTTVACGALLVWRLPQLAYRDPQQRSRGWFGQLLLTVLLVTMAIATTWGTIYPLIARAVRGQEIAVTPGFFNVVITPMGVALLGIFAVSPFLRDQRGDNLPREAALRGLLFAAVFGLVFAWVPPQFTHPGVAFTIATAALAVRSVLQGVRHPLGRALRSDQDRWWNVAHASSPYFAHLGIILLLASITLNVVGEVKEQTRIAVGETKTVSGVTITLDDVEVQQFADRASFAAFVSVLDEAGQPTAAIVSRLERFKNSEQLQAQVGISSSIMRDIYVVVDEANANPGAEWTRLTVYNNPWINWIWFGGFLMSLAGLLYLIPAWRRRRRPTASSVDDGMVHAVDTAILAVQAGITTTADERVNGLINSARTIAGETASAEELLAVLERLRSATLPAGGSRRGPGVRVLMGGGLAVLVLVAAGTYVANGLGGTAASSGTVDSSNATGPTIDQAQVTALMQAIGENPDDTVTLWNLGNVYFDAQQYGTALTWYRKLTGVTPNDPNVWIAAGAAAFHGGDQQAAFEDWTRASEVDPTNVESHYNLGFWYLSQQPSQEVKARAEWALVLERAPGSDLAKAVQQQLQQLGASAPSGAASGVTLTAAVVAEHASTTDCWTIVDGKVYDVTEWIGEHPGGTEVIRAMCGIDSTAAFATQHGLASKQAGILAGFLVGALGSPAA